MPEIYTGHVLIGIVDIAKYLVTKSIWKSIFARVMDEGVHMFAWIGAAVDVPHIVYKVLGTLGQKLYFFRLPFKEITTKMSRTLPLSENRRQYALLQAALVDGIA